MPFMIMSIVLASAPHAQLRAGITRAKKLLVIVGSKKALALAIRNNSVVKRNTMLAERIRALP